MITRFRLEAQQPEKSDVEYELERAAVHVISRLASLGQRGTWSKTDDVASLDRESGGYHGRVVYSYDDTKAGQ